MGTAMLPLCLLLPLFLRISFTFGHHLLNIDQLDVLPESVFGIPGNNVTYDYIVVGGGTAGLTVATRLSEYTNATVAVIEAGGFYEIDNGNQSIIPGYCSSLHQPRVDWAFYTTPQLGANKRTMHYPRGKTVGGTSARNFMLYTRWNNFLPYYEKSCNYTPPDPTRSTNATNHPAQVVSSPARGPLSVSFSNYVDPFGTWAQRALEFVGMSIIDAFNGGCLKGSAYTTVTIDPRNGHRSSSESSFFQDALRHGTVPTVYTNSLAQKILFDENKNAKGITVTTAGSYGVPDVQYRLGARHEIILSAGVFQSPQLLMVSGIGPNATLSKFNISCISDLNGVGKNMWDHSLFGTIHRVNVMTESSALSNSTIAAQNEEAFLVNATGPLSIFGTGYLGFEDLPHPYRSHLSHSTFTSLGTFPDDWPELEWFPVSAYDTIHPDPRDGANYATISTAVVSPSSRGNLTIQSASMSDPPLINPNSYTAAADVELAIAALHRQREVWRYLTDLGIAIGDEVQPGPHVQTDAELLDYIRSTYQPVNHAAATCKMGKRDDPMAVVDSKARVYGVKGLRVVDASAFPFLPPGNPQSTVYALAEKIAEEIVND